MKMVPPKRMQTTVGRRPKSLKPDAGTRADILAAARQVFARRGVDGTSVREVAAAAKVNKAMIYYHFKDKVDLYRAVLGDSFAALDRVWEHDIFQSSASSREKIQKYVEEFIRFEQSNEELRRIMSIEFASSGENCKWLADNNFRYHYEKLVLILKQGIRAGELKKFDPAIVISSLLGMIVHCFISRPIAEYVTGKKMDLSIKRFGKFITTIFLDGLALRPNCRQVRRK
jgi:TetR/AcrR family transcriptional regulator